MCDALDRVLRSDPCSKLYPEDLAQKTLCSQLSGPRHNLKKMKKGERMSSKKFIVGISSKFIELQILLPFLSLHFPPKKQTMQRFSQMLLWGASFVLDRNHCRTWKLQTSQLHGGMNEAVRSCAAATMLTTQSKHLKQHEWLSKSLGSHRTLI